MGKIQDEQHTRLLLSILETLSGAAIGIEKEDTDCGIISIPEFRYMPTIEFTEGEIELIKALGDEFGFDFSTLTEEIDYGMETRDFICVCLGVNWSTIERICENFDVDISDTEVYDILDLLEGKGYQKFGDLLMHKLFQDVEDRAVEDLKLDRNLFDWYVNGLDTHLYYNKQEVLRWEGLEDIADLIENTNETND